MKNILLCVGLSLLVFGCSTTEKNVSVEGDVKVIDDGKGGITMYGQCPDHTYSACVTYCKDGVCELIKWERKKKFLGVYTTIKSCRKINGETICENIK